MKKKTFLYIALFAFLISGCGRLSVDELAIEVKKSINETNLANGNEGIEIKNLVITHKSDNEYKGILTTSEPNGDFIYTLEIIYDGTNMTWEVVN